MDVQSMGNAVGLIPFGWLRIHPYHINELHFNDASETPGYGTRLSVAWYAVEQ